MVLGSPKEVETMDTSLWLGDSTGASCHMPNSLEGTINQVKVGTGIVFGNGQRLKAECIIGDKRGLVVSDCGNKAIMDVYTRNSTEDTY